MGGAVVLFAARNPCRQLSNAPLTPTGHCSPPTSFQMSILYHATPRACLQLRYATQLSGATSCLVRWPRASPCASTRGPAATCPIPRAGSTLRQCPLHPTPPRPRPLPPRRKPGANVQRNTHVPAAPCAQPPGLRGRLGTPRRRSWRRPGHPRRRPATQMSVPQGQRDVQVRTREEGGWEANGAWRRNPRLALTCAPFPHTTPLTHRCASRR